MSDIIELPAARPYNGKAQVQAVNAAVRHLVDAKVLTVSKSAINLPYVTVRAAWHLPQGMSRSIHVVHLVFGPCQDLQRRDEARRVTVDSLTAAGWTVADATFGTVSVYGPGVTEWQQADAARTAAVQEFAAERAAKTAAESARLTELLTRHGLPELADRHDVRATAKVTLTVEQLSTLLASAAVAATMPQNR